MAPGLDHEEYLVKRTVRKTIYPYSMHAPYGMKKSPFGDGTQRLPSGPYFKALSAL